MNQKTAQARAKGFVGNLPDEHIRVHPNLRIECPSVVNKTIRWQHPSRIGAYSMLHGPGSVCWAEIGRYCSIAPLVTIGANEHAMDWFSTSSLLENSNLYGWNKLIAADETPCTTMFHNSASIEKITIGNDVWIGQSAFIRNGVTIGDGAVIGAMSNVVSDVPPYCIYAGNPARFIRHRFQEDIIERLLRLQWHQYRIFDLFPGVSNEISETISNIERIIETTSLKPMEPYILEL